MNLREYQETFVRLCFAPTLDDADVRSLGHDAKRWRMYRHMVRGRLRGMVDRAYPMTLELVGEAAFEAAFSRWLAHAAPKSALIREAVAAAAQALFECALPSDVSAALLEDVVRFEHAKWELAYVPADYAVIGEAGVREVDFDGAPVLNPTLRLVRLSFAVFEVEHAREAKARRATLAMYRPPRSDSVRWWPLDAVSAALFEGAVHAPMRSLADGVRAASTALSRPLDPGFLEQVASTMALAVERGVLLGVR